MKVRIQVLFEILLMFKNCLPRSYGLYAGNGQLYSGFDTEEGLVPKGRWHQSRGLEVQVPL